MAIKNLSRGLIDSNKLSSAPGFFKIKNFFSLPDSAGNWAEDQNMFWDSGQIAYSVESFRVASFFNGVPQVVGPVFPLALLTFTNKKNNNEISSPMFFIPKKPTLVEYLLVGGGGNGGTSQFPCGATTYWTNSSGKNVGPGGGGGGGLAIGQIVLNPGSVFSINVGDSEENTTLSVHEISSTGVNSKVLVVAFAGGRGACLNSSGKIDTYTGGNGGGPPTIDLSPRSGGIIDDYNGYTVSEIGYGWIWGMQSTTLPRADAHAGGSAIPYFFPLNGGYTPLSSSVPSSPIGSPGNKGNWGGTTYYGGTDATGGSPGAVISGNSFTAHQATTSTDKMGTGILLEGPSILMNTLLSSAVNVSYGSGIGLPGTFSAGGSATTPDGAAEYTGYIVNYGTSYNNPGFRINGASSSFLNGYNGTPNSGGGGGATNQADSSYAGKGGSGIAYVRWGLR